jgi:hypothetical protein
MIECGSHPLWVRRKNDSGMKSFSCSVDQEHDELNQADKLSSIELIKIFPSDIDALKHSRLLIYF